MLSALEAKVQLAKLGKFQWLEVDEEILKHFLQNKYPGPGYFIYKDIRLCLPGMAEEIADREDIDVHAVLFKDEAKTMSVSTQNKK